jgi:hypothetical protein
LQKIIAPRLEDPIYFFMVAVYFDTFAKILYFHSVIVFIPAEFWVQEISVFLEIYFQTFHNPALAKRRIKNVV